jgi:5-methylcytosine-specific restriction endonuclease McrA
VKSGSALERRSGLLRKKPLSRLGARKRRRLDDLRRFREVVVERARGACERCGIRGRRLDAHHLVPVARGGPDDPENGAALCRPCHRAVHGSPPPPDVDRWIRRR